MTVDGYGFSPEYFERAMKIFGFLAKRYWRVETYGLERIPQQGRALLVQNHGGGIGAWDVVTLKAIVLQQMPQPRPIWTLAADFLAEAPYIGTFFWRTGHVLACWEHGTRLLQEDQLVLVCPEGARGPLKLFKDRYKLERFGRGGFAKLAVRTKAPIIPISYIGPDELYITLARSKLLGRLVGFPAAPITLRLPWLGPLGLIPLPSKWYIHIGEPIDPQQHRKRFATEEDLIRWLAKHVRDTIQNTLNMMLAKRRSMFFG